MEKKSQYINAPLFVGYCSHAAALYAVKNLHYSKTLPSPPVIRFGVWEFGHFIGVVLYSRGANTNLYKPYGIAMHGGAELTRVALRKHKNAVSKIISITIKILKKDNPKLRCILSFADPYHNHHGGIYQAGNWVYLGTSAKSYSYKYMGKTIHPRLISSTGTKKQFGVYKKCHRPDECEKIIIPGKHRYIYPLDDEMKKIVDKMRKPYPKRPKQAMDGTTVTAEGQHLPGRSKR